LLIAGPEIPEGDNVDRPVCRDHPARVELRKHGISKKENRNKRNGQTVRHGHFHITNLSNLTGEGSTKGTLGSGCHSSAAPLFVIFDCRGLLTVPDSRRSLVDDARNLRRFEAASWDRIVAGPSRGRSKGRVYE
jgi:hypothetical protein